MVYLGWGILIGYKFFQVLHVKHIADGNRVRKYTDLSAANGTLYWYMTPGIIAESDQAGTLKSEYVFFDGARVARKDFPATTVAYYFSDRLKTASVVTDAAGMSRRSRIIIPGAANCSSRERFQPLQIYRRRTRYGERSRLLRRAVLLEGLGRWVSADSPFADQHAANPQSWNLYVTHETIQLDSSTTMDIH